MRFIKQIKLVTLSILLSLLFVSPVFAATITIENVEQKDTGTKLTVVAELNRDNEQTIIVRRIFSNGQKSDRAVTPAFFDINGDGAFNEMKFTPFLYNSDGVAKVEFLVQMKDKRLVKVSEYTNGGQVPPTQTVKPPYVKPPVIDNDGMNLDTGLPGSNVTVQDGNGSEIYNGNADGTGKVYVPLANSMPNSPLNFTWEFFNGHHIRYDYDDPTGDIESEWTLGTMQNGQFTPVPYDYNGMGVGDGPYETTYEPNAPDGGYYMRIQLKDGYTGELKEEYIFSTDGILGYEPTAYPLKAIVKDEQGNPYEYTINQDGTVTPNGEIAAESYPEEGGDGTTPPPTGGDGCIGCELLNCPGWDQIADKIGSAVAGKLPPPPNWPEVAKIFGDELVPRIGDEIDKRLGKVEPPAQPIKEPTFPVFDGSTGKLIPKPTFDPSQLRDTNLQNIPSVPVNQDNTGGISLEGADPIDNMPHDPEGYMPTPGQETGGDRPQNKPVETPVPSNTVPPELENNPTPGTTTEEPPTPGGSTSPPPAPELPMPNG